MTTDQNHSFETGHRAGSTGPTTGAGEPECSGRRVVLPDESRIEEIARRDVAVQNLSSARQMDEVIVGVFDGQKAEEKRDGTRQRPLQ